MSQNDSKSCADGSSDYPYDSWEQVYQQSGMHELPWDTAEAHPLLIELFKDHHAKPGARALDLGCGTGASSRLLAQIGYEVDAWDMSETAIDRAGMLSKNGGGSIRYFAGNAIKCALNTPDSYDLVLDFLFLHHIQDEDIKAYFTGVQNSVRAGGHYVVGVIVQTEDLVKRPSFFSVGQVRYWTQNAIEQNLGSEYHCCSASYGLVGSAAHNYPGGIFIFVKDGDQL